MFGNWGEHGLPGGKTGQRDDKGEETGLGQPDRDPTSWELSVPFIKQASVTVPML